MTYVKQEWRDLPDETTPLSAARLNHIEDGVFEAVASASDAGVAAILADPASAASQAVESGLLTPRAVMASVRNYPGIDPTGLTDSSAGLQAALDDAVDGNTVIIPLGTYRIEHTLTTTRAVTVEAYGARFIKAADVVVFNFLGSYDTPLPVLALAPAAITDDTQAATPGTAITVSAGPTWKRGDAVKVFADDVIPGGRLGSDGKEARVGQFLIVSNVTGNVVNCVGRLTDTYSENVRVARITNKAAHLRGGEFETLQSGLDGAWSSNMVQFRSMSGPTVKDVRILSTAYSGFRFSGCYGYTVDSCAVDYAKNDQAAKIFGYGIQDSSSAFGRVVNYLARRVRHAWTDGSAFQLAGTLDPANYGRTYGAQIANSSCYGSSNTAWDTHSWSEGVTFSDTHAVECFKGFALRGRRHKVIDCSVTSAIAAGLNIFTEADGGDSWGHYVRDFTTDGTPQRALEVYINPTGHPLENVREARQSIIDGLTIWGGAQESIFIRSATIRLDNIRLIAAADLTEATKLIFARNSQVDGARWVVDTRDATVGAGTALIYEEVGSAISVADIDHRASATSAPLITFGIDSESSASTADIRRMVSTHPFGSFIYRNLGAGSIVDWEYLSSGENSSWITASDASISSATGAVLTLSRTRERQIYMRLTANAGAQTLAPFQPGVVRGQRVTVWNISTSNTVTVNHGTSAKTVLIGATAKALAPGEQMTLVWQNSSWWEV